MKSTSARYENFHFKILPLFYKYDKKPFEDFSHFSLYIYTSIKASYEGYDEEDEEEDLGTVKMLTNTETKKEIFKKRGLNWQTSVSGYEFFVLLEELFHCARFSDLLQNTPTPSHPDFNSEKLNVVFARTPIQVNQIKEGLDNIRQILNGAIFKEDQFIKHFLITQYKYYFTELVHALEKERNETEPLAEFIDKLPRKLKLAESITDSQSEKASLIIQNINAEVGKFSKTPLDFYREWIPFTYADDLSVYDHCINDIVSFTPGTSKTKEYRVKRSIIWELAKYSGKKISKYTGPDDPSFTRDYSKHLSRIKA